MKVLKVAEDKVAVEVPSPVAGILSEQLVAVGDTVQVGAVIALVEEGGAGAAAKPAATPDTTRERYVFLRSAKAVSTR